MLHHVIAHWEALCVQSAAHVLCSPDLSVTLSLFSSFTMKKERNVEGKPEETPEGLWRISNRGRIVILTRI